MMKKTFKVKIYDIEKGESYEADVWGSSLERIRYAIGFGLGFSNIKMDEFYFWGREKSNE